MLFPFIGLGTLTSSTFYYEPANGEFLFKCYYSPVLPLPLMIIFCSLRFHVNVHLFFFYSTSYMAPFVMSCESSPLFLLHPDVPPVILPTNPTQEAHRGNVPVHSVLQVIQSSTHPQR